MSTLDEITQEKQRVSEALARIDAQREKLASRLGELEATERVLARYSRGAPARRTGSAKTTTAAKATAPAQSRRRPRSTAAKSAARGVTAPSLGDQILTLANGKTQQEIAAACDGVRANHVGIAIARHKRAGRIEERDGRALCDAIDAATPTLCGLTPEQKTASVLCRRYGIPSMETEQRAMLWHSQKGEAMSARSWAYRGTSSVDISYAA